MATISRNFGSQTQVIGTGNDFITLSGTTESFSSDINLETNGYEGAQVIIEMDYDATPTDEVNINIYGSLDGTNYDDTPIFSQQGDHDTDPQQLSFIIKDLLHFRIGVVQSGTTDSHNVRAYIQTWNWQSV